MRNKFLSLFIALFTIISVFSCREDDKVFEQNASERLNQTLLETRDVLASAENGWLIKMFPGEEMKYGGYNLLAKFDKDGNVEATNELIQNFERHKSVYSLNGGNGPTISFVTFNKAIHIFSEPRADANFPDSNPQTGADGDLVFTIVSVSKDKVLLKGLRSGVIITAVPFPSEYTWESYLEKSLEMKEKFKSDNFILSLDGKEVFGKNTSSSNYRVLKIEQKDTHKTFDIPFRYTPEGIEAYKEFDFGFGKVSKLASIEGTDSFKSTDSELMYKIRILPLIDYLTNGIWYMSYSKSSATIQSVIDAADKYPSTSGIALNPLRFLVLGGFDNGKTFAFLSEYTWDGESMPLFFNIIHNKISDNEISMAINREKVTGNANYVYTRGFDRIVGAILGPKDNPKVYTLSTDNPRKPTSIKLVDKADPNNWFELTSDGKYDPRNQ